MTVNLPSWKRYMEILLPLETKSHTYNQSATTNDWTQRKMAWQSMSEYIIRLLNEESNHILSEEIIMMTRRRGDVLLSSLHFFVSATWAVSKTTRFFRWLRTKRAWRYLEADIIWNNETLLFLQLQCWSVICREVALWGLQGHWHDQTAARLEQKEGDKEMPMIVEGSKEWK